MVIIVFINVWDIAEITLHVITWLVSVKGDAKQVGKEHYVTKVCFKEIRKSRENDFCVRKVCLNKKTLQKLLSKDDYLTNLSVLWKILHTRWTVSFQNRRHFIFISLYLKNVTVILDMTAWTTVVVTVWMVPSVTNWLATVIEDVTQDIPTATVTEVGIHVIGWYTFSYISSMLSVKPVASLWCVKRFCIKTRFKEQLFIRFDI